MQNIEIVVKGHLDPHWSDWLEGMTVVHTADQNTLLCGEVADQSALYGLLSRLRDLGLTLISVVSTDQDEARPQTGSKEVIL